jgi:two-component system, NarL family, sensor histidine kinase DesK
VLAVARDEHAPSLRTEADGAAALLGAAGQGSGLAGLAGLAERARELSGSVAAGPDGDGRFRLLVQLPREAA